MYFRAILVRFGCAEIMDYSSALFIPIPIEDVALYHDNFYLKHLTNLSSIQRILYDNINVINDLKNVKDKELLRNDVQDIERLMRMLQQPIRNRRSIDFIGSGIKFIAGVPDHQDFLILQSEENELVRANNRQIDINNALQDKIDEITDRINNLNNLDSHQTTEFQTMTMLMTRRNRIIIDNLTNNLHSILFAKINLVNPLMFNSEELEMITLKEHIFTPINDLLSVSNVKMYYQNELLVYLIKIPKVAEICKFYEIALVAHNNKILDIKTNLTANCNGKYYPLNNCKKALSYSYCNVDHNEFCVVELLNNHTARCPTTSSYHLEKIVEIRDGLIIARDDNTIVQEGEPSISVNGTFLISFKDEITVNGKSFTSNNPKNTIQFLPPKTTILNETEFREKLSLPYLHRMHIVNNQKIEEFKINLETSKWTWYGVIAVLVLVIAVILYMKLKPKLINIKTQNIQPKTSQPALDLQKSREDLQARVARIMYEDVQI